MTENYDQFLKGAIDYSQFQKQQLNQAFDLGVQQANQLANRSHELYINSKESAAQANIIHQLNRNAAIRSYADVVKYTRLSLDFQNKFADRTIAKLKHNVQTQQRATAINQQVYNKIIEQRKGAVIARDSAGGGAVAERGGDSVLSIVKESKKDAAVQYKADFEKMIQLQESVYAAEISKAFNNFNTETQIKFSSDTFKSQI